MYKMIPFDEAKDNLAKMARDNGFDKEEIDELTKKDTVLAIDRSRWDRIIKGYIIDPDPLNFETMTVYKIFPVDKDLDMIQLPDFLLEKL